MKIPPNISVRDICRINHIKIEITQSVSKIFAYNFRNQFRIEFRPILWVPMFDNLAARYRAITYREYVDIAPTRVSTQPP